jgi:hypothetical protein
VLLDRSRDRARLVAGMDHADAAGDDSALIAGVSCRTVLSKELWTSRSPL